MSENEELSSSTGEALENRLQRAERRVRWLSVGMVVLAAGLVLGMTVPGTAESGRMMARASDVLTVRGLVIVDDAGRERVVIGAPAAAVSPDERLAESTGMIVLDSLGRLSVAVGSDRPLILEDGSVGKRIGSSSGLTFYDPRNGMERGGIGAFEDGRANVCLDYGTGSKEAACMAVAPGDEYAMVMLNGTPREEVFDRVGMFLGADGVGVLKAMGGLENRSGVFIRAGAGGAMPTMTIYDSAQTEVMDLVGRAGGR